jgi:hypothetical protein
MNRITKAFKTTKSDLRNALFSAIVVSVFVGHPVLAHAAPTDGFHLKEGLLHRGEARWHVRAFTDEDALDRGSDAAAIAPALARIAECGGDAIVATLPGLSNDGRILCEEAAATVQAWADRAKDSRMALILRVPLEQEDDASRRRAAKTVGKALRHITHALYLIEGEHAAELVPVFKRYAPRCLVVAQEGGDITLVSAWPEAPEEGRTYLLAGALPPSLEAPHHFWLEGTEENRKLLDEAMTTGVEKTAQPLDASLLSEEERAEGFVPLFNGRDLSNWWVFGDNPNGFHVSECGEIEWQEAGAAALLSAKRYGDFVLRLEYKLIPGGNSGIFLRAPRAARQSKIGMEFQLHGDAGAPVSDDGTGAIYTVVPPLVNPAKPGLQWNQLEITLQGDHIRGILNGELVQHLDLSQGEELPHRLRRGFIGLQDHDNYVAFRNIRIKEL